MTAVNEKEAAEILEFLKPSSFGNVKGIAMEYFLGMTGNEEGLDFIASNEKYLSAIVQLTYDDINEIVKDAYLALINLTAREDIAIKLSKLDSHPDFLFDTLKYILQPDSPFADIATGIVTNMSRSTICAHRFVNLMISRRSEVGFDQVIGVFCRENFNSKNKLHHLGPFVSNLTQIQDARKYVLDKEKCVIQRLLAFTNYSESLTRRGGVLGAVKNCCFETEFHSWLLSEKVDILPRLLLPLAGPEEFDDEDNEKLPEELQYLEPEKTREPDPDIRKMLVEAVTQLCATEKGRKYIRDKNTYVIMRELDNWETDPANKIAIEALIQILIGDEPEEGMKNLKEVEIPKNVEEKLQEAYEKQLEEVEELKKQEEEAAQ